MKNNKEIKEIVKEKYSEIAKNSSCSCGCNNSKDISKSIGYSEHDINSVEGNLGLGCGNPVAISKIKKGDVVLDLGCVAGALLKEDYLQKIKEAGFSVNILYENKEISKVQYNGINLESLMIEAIK